MHIDLTQQTALVTGATRGIGKAIAAALARSGAYVIGTATSDAGAAAISEMLGSNGKGLVFQAGVEGAVQKLFAQIAENELQPLILVNNAGITRDTLLMRMDEEQWDAVIATNLTAVMQLTKAAIKGMMKARSGRIISISSVVASLGNAGQANYAASKGGVEAMNRALARELAGRNITVNAVAPGYIATDMTNSLTEEQTRMLMGNIPLGKMGTPHDIAQAVVFLASAQASYITGHTLHVNGGMLMG